MNWVIVDENGNIVSQEFETQAEAINFLKQMDQNYLLKTRMHVKGVHE